MARERSAGTIIFRRGADGKVRYLLLQYMTTSRHWDFPKGHIEKGETAHTTARREVKEETGITDLKLRDGFQVDIAYYYQKERETNYKEVVFFLAETKSEKIKLSHEHVSFRWATYHSALKQLTYENAKEVLRKAHAYLTQSPS